MQLQTFFLSVPTTDTHNSRYIDRLRRKCGDSCLTRAVTNIPKLKLNLDRLLTLSDMASKSHETGQALINKLENELYRVLGSTYRPKIETSRESISWYEYCLHFVINEKILGVKLTSNDEESSKITETDTSAVDMDGAANANDENSSSGKPDNYIYTFFEAAQKNFNETNHEMTMLTQQIRDIEHQITAKKRVIGGGLAVKPLDDVLNNENCFDIAFVKTLLFVIPRNQEEEFLKTYEFLGRREENVTEGKKSRKDRKSSSEDAVIEANEANAVDQDTFFGVMPNSALKITVEDQFILYSVIVCKKDVQNVIAAAREKKWIIRADVSGVANQADGQDQTFTNGSAAAVLGVYGLDEIENDNAPGSQLVSQVIKEMVEKERENAVNITSNEEDNLANYDNNNDKNFEQVDMEENEKENFAEITESSENQIAAQLQKLQDTVDQKKKTFGQWLMTTASNTLVYFLHVSCLKAYIEGILRFGDDIDVIIAVCPEKATFVYNSKDLRSGKYIFESVVDSNNGVKNTFNDSSYLIRIKTVKEAFVECFEDLAERVISGIERNQNLLLRTMNKDKKNAKKQNKMDTISDVIFDKNIDTPNAFLPFIYVPCVLEEYGILRLKQMEKNEKSIKASFE